MEGKTMKHEASCACDLCVAWRAALVEKKNPLMHKKIQPTKIIIPVDQKIAQIREAIDCYEGKLSQLYTEMKILRDE
jgi:rubrerythrin